MTYRLEGAACAGLTPEQAARAFFSSKASRATKAMCAGCSVLEQCRADALDVERGLPLDFRVGFRAGMTAPQRHALEAGLTVVG